MRKIIFTSLFLIPFIGFASLTKKATTLSDTTIETNTETMEEYKIRKSDYFKDETRTLEQLIFSNQEDALNALDIIKNNNSLGLPLDASVNQKFEKMLKTQNLIFSSGIDLIYEFFNVERKTRNTLLSKTIQYLGKNPNINSIFKKVADKGVIL